MFTEAIRRMIKDIEANLDNCNDGDVERSYYCAGNVAAWCQVLMMMGHEVEHGTWIDDGKCNHEGYLAIDGKVLVKNGKFDYKVYQELTR